MDSLTRVGPFLRLWLISLLEEALLINQGRHLLQTLSVHAADLFVKNTDLCLLQNCLKCFNLIMPGNRAFKFEIRPSSPSFIREARQLPQNRIWQD